MESWLLLGVLAALYFLPVIVAWSRRVPSKWGVAVVNVFLGWTLIGWVAALAWAAGGQKG